MDRTSFDETANEITNTLIKVGWKDGGWACLSVRLVAHTWPRPTHPRSDRLLFCLLFFS